MVMHGDEEIFVGEEDGEGVSVLRGDGDERCG